LRQLPRIVRIEPLLREDIVQVLGDDVGLVDHALAVGERRNEAVGVELEIRRVALLQA